MANVNLQGAVPTPPQYQQGENYVLHDPNITQTPAYYKELLSVAKQSVRILDPYAFQYEAIEAFEVVCSENIQIEIVTRRYDSEDLIRHRDNIENILKKNIRNYSLTIYSYFDNGVPKQQRVPLWHDRYLIVDDTDIYLIGSSIDGQVKSDKYHGIYHLDRDKDIEIVVNLYKFYQNSYNTFRAIKTSRHHP